MTFPGRKRFLKSLRAFSFRLAILCLAPYQVFPAFTPGGDRERIYFNAKNLTANPEDPYAEPSRFMVAKSLQPAILSKLPERGPRTPSVSIFRASRSSQVSSIHMSIPRRAASV